jgi:hypothetical protein
MSVPTAITDGISGFYGTADCAKTLVFKANSAFGKRFFEPGGREFESLRARIKSNTYAAHFLTTVPFKKTNGTF